MCVSGGDVGAVWQQWNLLVYLHKINNSIRSISFCFPVTFLVFMQRVTIERTLTP